MTPYIIWISGQIKTFLIFLWPFQRVLLTEIWQKGIKVSNKSGRKQIFFNNAIFTTSKWRQKSFIIYLGNWTSLFQFFILLPVLYIIQKVQFMCIIYTSSHYYLLLMWATAETLITNTFFHAKQKIFPIHQ